MRGRGAVVAVVLAIGALALDPPRAAAQGPDPVLERYSIRAGADDAAGVRAVLVDPSFGRGTARSRLLFQGSTGLESPTPATLSLRVSRTVPPDTITFALLVFRVDVRGFDAAGALVYSRRLPGFTFGDSASGDWRRILILPAETQRVTVVFVGNYE
jgi:hypothetical protein